MPSRFTPSEFGLPDHVHCPFCRSRDTVLQSPFGAQLSVATYWCNPCHTAFEFMKSDVEQKGERDGDGEDAAALKFGH